MKCWVAYGGRTALNTKQLKLGLGSSDTPEPKLVENRGQVAKKVTTNKNVDAVYGMVMRAG